MLFLNRAAWSPEKLPQIIVIYYTIGFATIRLKPPACRGWTNDSQLSHRPSIDLAPSPQEFSHSISSRKRCFDDLSVAHQINTLWVSNAVIHWNEIMKTGSSGSRSFWSRATSVRITVAPSCQHVRLLFLDEVPLPFPNNNCKAAVGFGVKKFPSSSYFPKGILQGSSGFRIRVPLS